MFSNKKSDSLSGAGGIGADNPFETSSMSTSSSRPSYDGARSSSGHSIVDECLTMKGDLESEGDIMVKGRVFGNIKCKVLIIDANALVEGGVEAEEVIVRGSSKGTVRATRVRLEKSASVESDIYHQTFSAEEGARIKGALRYKDDPLSPDPAETTARTSRVGKNGNGSSATMAAVTAEVVS